MTAPTATGHTVSVTAPVLLWLTRTVPDLTDKALRLDEIENRHETLVRPKERIDLLGQRGESSP